MGLDIEKITIMDVVEVTDVYCKVKNMNLVKKDTGIFSLTYYAGFIKDSRVILEKPYTIEQEAVFTEPWVEAYNHFKEELTKDGINYQDNI